MHSPVVRDPAPPLLAGRPTETSGTARFVRFPTYPGTIRAMEITVDELRALADTGATILNVGKHAGHREIRGAARYRPNDLLTPDHLTIPIAPDKPVILYDEHGDSALTKQVAEKLQANGFKDVRTLQGGFAAWEKADAPTQEPSIEQVVPPTNRSEVQALDRRI